VRPATGTGNQKAYLAEVGRDAVRVVLSAANLNLEEYERTSPSVTIDDFRTRAEDALEHEMQSDLTLDQTIRDQLTRARRGQGLFRRRVMSLESVCRVTGINNPTLLVASHVKPWRSCQTADERLDGHNGLMLAPHADFLFDRGLLSFADDGHALFSPKLSEADGIRMGLFHSQRPPPRPFQSSTKSYLDHHRRVIFIN
jgi:hypothetical protein